SVGGKTGINTPRGKNLVGTFYPPRLVCIAGSHLKTLGPREHAAGIAEAIKIASCVDIQLFKQIVADMEGIVGFDMEKLLPVLRRSVALKAFVVSQDEKERGLRAVLNYGHTIGHAIERGQNYTILHGEAVALGMVAEAEWADSEGISSGIAKAMEGVLASAGLPVNWKNVRVDMTALRLDKKRVGTSVQMPVVTALGQFEFKSVPISAVAEFVARRSVG
ncbi:MAG: 3-dehydroquinate synthase family protein, partial [Myxococcota bacterium]